MHAALSPMAGRDLRNARIAAVSLSDFAKDLDLSGPRSFTERSPVVATSFYGQRGDPAGPLAEFGPTLAAVFGLKQCAVAQAGE